MARSRKFTRLVALTLATLSITLGQSSAVAYDPIGSSGVVDLTPTVYTNRVQWWPGGHEQPIIVPYHKWGPDGPWASDLLIVDENTGNQVDCPPHMVPPPDSGLPNAGYWGTLTCDKVPISQWLGEVVKIDARGTLDKAKNGESPIITKDMVLAAERAHRPLQAGDAVLYWSGYDDKYDKPMPEGARLIVTPFEGKSPAWPRRTSTPLSTSARRACASWASTARAWAPSARRATSIRGPSPASRIRWPSRAISATSSTARSTPRASWASIACRTGRSTSRSRPSTRDHRPVSRGPSPSPTRNSRPRC